MRVLIAVALLMMCTALAQRIEPAPKQEKAQPAPDYEQRWIDGKCFSVPKDLWLGGANPILPCSGEAKQEKAQPSSGTGIMTIAPPPGCKDAKFGEMCISKDGWFMRNLPFDIPAKETIEGAECVGDGCGGYVHYSCQDVAPDWKQRVLLDSADGKHHCYAFYLLGKR